MDINVITCGPNTRTCRSLFRYQGGKSRLCKNLVSLFPPTFNAYIEPFVGAGSVWLEVWNRGFRGPTFLGDRNLEVVNVHHVMAANPDGFERAYALHIERHSRGYFYLLRDLDTSGWTPVEKAARTVYLSKAAFHGLLRVNTKGNVVSTYGTGELSRMRLDGSRIHAVSAALQNAHIRCGDFGWVGEVAQPGDLVFLDPPYFGGNVAYTAEGFRVEDHLRLHSLCRTLDAKGVLFVQTNADRLFVRDLYRGFHFVSVSPAPAIGRGGAGKQPVGELVIANFEPEARAAGKFEVAA
ncbi:MAG: DNA adenine methylase [Kiritimatiellia bacterium]